MNDIKVNKVPTDKLPTQLTLMVRLLVGGYLLYTDYSLIGSFSKPDTSPQEKVFFGVAMLAFLVIGVVLIFLSAKYYKEGRYQGGAMDAGEDMASFETANAVGSIQEVEAESKEDN